MKIAQIVTPGKNFHCSLLSVKLVSRPAECGRSLTSDLCVPAHRQVSERVLPQWLTGIIAVVGFLFLAFVIFLVKKAWCENLNSMINNKRICINITFCVCLLIRSKEDMNAYNNLVIDSTDDKVTAM
uniref:Uncharacterized protein n=1 Tax=Echeneis naucrates TaxID=173247 RepID=A0A665VJ65_ECHNA